MRPNCFERDRRLLALWKAGNKERGKELLGHYHVFMLGLCMRAGILTAMERDEVYEEVILAILKDLPRLELRTFFSKYLEKKFARVLALRKKGALPRLPADRSSRGKFAPLEGEELPYAILECEKELEKPEAFVFRARIFDNAPFSLIAKILGLKIEQLSVVLHRARSKVIDGLRNKGFAVDEGESRTMACGSYRGMILLLRDRSLEGRRLRKTVDHLKACKACRDFYWDIVSFERELVRGVGRLPFESRSYLNRVFSEAFERSLEKSDSGIKASWIRGVEVAVAFILVAVLAAFLIPARISDGVLNALAGLFSP